jgi:hypothetical protein
VAPDARPRGRTVRAGLALAVSLPALFAGSAAVIVTGSAPPGVEHPRDVAALALMAELAAPAEATPLRPLSPRRGSAALRVQPLERVDGGIRPAPPARIAIPAAHVDAPVQAVLSRAGALEVPPVGTAGWFSGGPRPGEPGRAVVIGHLDSRKGPGLFARVPRLPAGTPIAITDQGGAVHRFRVVGGAQVRKEDFPAEHVFGHSDRSVLVLVTCGGPYSRKSGYRDNVLLYARSG